MTIENSGDSQLPFLAPESAGYTSRINFGSVTNARDGMIAYTQSSDYMAFSTANAERLRILATGAIGIGNTAPGEKLEVTGAINFNGAATSNAANSGKLTYESAGAYLQSRGADASTRGKITLYQACSDGSSGLASLAIDASGNVALSSHLDMPDSANIKLGTGDDLQLYHNGSHSYIVENGTGQLYLASNYLSITNAAMDETMATFDDDGAVSLYYDNVVKLQTASGGVTIPSSEVILSDGRNIQWGGANCRIQGTNNGDFEIFTGATVRFTITNAGVTSLPDNGKLTFGASGDLEIYHDASNSYVADAGTGTLNLIGNQVLIKNAANDETMLRCVQDSDVELYFNGAEKLRTLVGGVDIVGAITKDSGSFRIRHPVESKKATKDLVHSFIEGPKADLIYRGKVALVSGSATVNIDTVSTMTDGTFVLLCGDIQCFTTNETGWTAIKGSVSGNVLTITAQDGSCTDTISWMVVGERKDQHMIDTDWTDSAGHVIVEPDHKARHPE